MILKFVIAPPVQNPANNTTKQYERPY